MERMDVIIDVENGLAVPEAKIVSTVDSIVAAFKEGMPCTSIGSHDIVDEIRLRVKRREIDATFIYNEVRIPVLPDGRLPVWPAGFPGDYHDKQLCELLNWTE